MNQTASMQKIGTGKEARAQLQRQRAEDLAQQSESTQSIHRWMNRLEVAGVGLMVAVFIVALYLSILWKSVHPMLIPIVWFAFAASIAPTLFFSGLDSILLRAFPTSVMPGGAQKFVTGNTAVWIGVGFLVLALIVAAFWSVFAYATLTLNFTLLQPLIGFLGVLMAAAILIGMVQKTISKLSK